ncbi:integrator complex assembly factor BRAT1 isoform X2 [Perca flavescens]|uniref:integrator complex assembly factor BRAT1 isoform X2 n=1 Tax=Perca flavescens TaxID=8167 RepID=UPI00106DFB13|nr:BRCA1-associated ATM activator 1 isoform X2 [Perca flavescens]
MLITHTHVSTMDRECASLLPSVCEVLADSGRSVPDDTSLEKLLDWFTGLTEAGGSLLEACPCLLKFISTVVYNAASDPGVLSFTLRLTGLMAATEDGFKMLQERSVLNQVFNLQHWQEAGLWDDPCLRIGWIQGLRSTLQHPKALRFFVQSDFIDSLLQLQTDTSLFVASAANRMLAHILLFFQKVSSAGSNSVNKKEEDDERGIHHSATDLEPPAVTMETSAEYSAVVKGISEYLKESLIPKENTKLHQSLQILKLLALLLAQAGPPLRDKLLQRVTDSLEQLVTAGCSQLTLPLMDVILAANSCGPDGRVPDQRVTRLLSSMLSVNNAADRCHAAAALLRRGHHDTVHTARAVRILLLPLDIITGPTLLGTNASADEHPFSVVEQLKSKTSCISMICVCLTNTPQITLTPPGVLPCPPVLIVTAVVSLLRICSGTSSSSSTGSSEVCRNVIGSGKVQKCALEALTALNSSPGAKEKISEVFTILIQYLDSPDSDPTVLHKSYQALVKWIRVCTDLSLITDQLRQDLVEVVKKRACDMRWEVRDSTVEFLGHLAGVHVSVSSGEEVCDASEALLGGCCTTPLLREALQDTESYVRASAISALAKTLTHSWRQGAALTQDQTEIVSRLLEILSQDTEGFPRRAVVQYFISWFFSRSSHSPPSSSASLLMQCVRTVLSQGSADLDWEVKVHTLELAELLLDQAFSAHRGYRNGSDAHRALQRPYGVVSDQAYTLHTHTEGVQPDLAYVVEQGVISALLSGLVDCDRPVALKACRLLITLRETICPLSLGALDATAATATVPCELPGRGWGQEITKILEMEKSDRAREADVSAQRSSSAADGGGDGVSVSVCEVLRSLGLDQRLDVLTQSSDHIHNSPLSLLQDILTASGAHAHPDTKPGQEVIVDCY